MVRMGRKRGMQHPGDRVVGREELDHAVRVGHVALDPQRQGLDALQDVERVLRAHAGAEVAQALGPRPHVEGRRPIGLGVDQAVVAGIGQGHGREFVRGLPLEPAAVDQHAADCDAVAAQPLGRRMQHQIGARLERPAEARRGEGVVDEHRQAVRVRDLGDLRDVQDLEAGIADRLAEHEARLGPDRGRESQRIARVDEARLDPEARQGQLQEVGRAAIERLGRDDVAARPHQGHDRQMQRRLTARGRDRADPALERRDPLLEHRGRRVRDPRIDVPGALEVEQRRRLVGVGEHVGRGLVDRHRARPGRGVRPLPGVQRERVELQKLGLGHR